MSSLKVFNNDLTCRTCLNDNLDLIDIFSTLTSIKVPVVSLLFKYAPVQIKKDDGLPSLICQSCLTLLLKFHQFQQKALESDDILRRSLKEQSLRCNRLEEKRHFIEKDGENVDFNTIKFEKFHEEYTKNQRAECIKVKKENDPFSKTDFDSGDEISDKTNEFNSNEESEINYNKKNFVKLSHSKRTNKKTQSKGDTSDILQLDNTINKKRYHCVVCNKYFSRKYHLTDHQRTHTGEKPFQCDDCGRCFSQKFALNIHKRKHTGERPFQCDICNKRFSQTSGLTVHKQLHTGEKPYQCDVCSKFFARKIQLQNHKRIHTREKPFQCDVCDKCFSLKGTLNTHKRLHTGDKPFHCGVCFKRFTASSHLKTHSRTHTGERPYTCNVCNKCFKDTGSLTSHKRFHSGERPFQCEVCNKCFVYKSNLYTHKRTHINCNDK